MKINVSSKALYNLTSAVSKIINNKNPMQILNNFLFTLEGDTLMVKGQDIENFLVGRIAVTNAEGGGSFCLDARRLVELLKLMPDQGLEIEVADNLETKIDYSNGCYQTVAISGAEFPSESEDENGAEPKVEFICPASTLLAGVNNTIFAVGDEEIRPQMMGVLFDIKPDRIIFVSTDTRKLVRYTDGNVHPDVECSMILPLKGATILKTILNEEDSVKMTVSEKNVTFETESFKFDCRLIKGRYPDYNRVIPSSNPYTLTVDNQSFLKSVRRVAVGGDEGSCLIRFKFENKGLTLESVDAAYNTSGWEHVQCDFDGPNFTIGFDSNYVIDILATFTATDILMRLGDPSRPALLTPVENEPGIDHTIILMPMNIPS